VVRTVSRQAAALTKARERRRALDAARDEHDRRVEEATAEALVALEARSEAEQALAAATAALGERLRTLLAEDVPAERAAALLELDTAEVRRLTKAAGRPAVTPTKPVTTAAPRALRRGRSVEAEALHAMSRPAGTDRR
jgi:electron transfer flavoprotein alpha subunit